MTCLSVVRFIQAGNKILCYLRLPNYLLHYPGNEPCSTVSRLMLN